MDDHDAAALRARARDKGFTPSVRDVPGLLELLVDEDDTPAIFRALERVAEAASAAAIARFATAAPGHRARLCELVGRRARVDATLVPWLVERLQDDDARVRRRAATAVGKLEDPRHEAALLAAWHRAESDPERKVVAAALGQAGGADARALLAAVQTDDAQFERVVRESLLKLERTELRSLGTAIALDTVPSAPVAIELAVRPGLEAMVCAAIPGAKAGPRGTVRVTWSDSLAALYEVRTFVDLGFALPPVALRSHDAAAVETAVVRALSSDAAMRILSTWTRGPLRWRLEWLGQGHRRASTWRVVEALALSRPELVNDPRDAPWEARVTVERDELRVVLRPRGLVDPRFAWRRGAVPASSHPTIAAALAQVAGVREDDVVWDPFVGAGAELVERGLLGPAAMLLGTDLEPAALDAARANLDAAGLGHAVLEPGDACTFRPPRPVTLLITNPPMGHRVPVEGPVRGPFDRPRPTSESTPIGDLLERAVRHWIEVLAPDARIVWLSPAGDRTAAIPGVTPRLRQRVDLGGLAAELQVLECHAKRTDHGAGQGAARGVVHGVGHGRRRKP